MKNILYLSTAIKLMNEDQLTGILNTARKNNTSQNVSGVLFYSEGTFIQLLEGDDNNVDAIFIKIALDKRHKNITVLIDDAITEKNFPDWSMGFATTNANEMKNITGYLSKGKNLNTKDKNSQAISILKTFIDTNKLAIKY